MDLKDNKQAKPSCFHIGLAKTGTTTLQRYLFPEHSQIYYLGKWSNTALSRHPELQRREFMKGNPTGCRNPLVEELLFRIFKQKPSNFDIARCVELFSQSVLPSVDKNKIPVWSWEGIATSLFERRRSEARNLRLVFGPCKIIIVLRNPVKLMVSLYLQRLKATLWGNKMTKWGGPNFPSFEKWLQNQWARLEDSLLDYARTIEIYADQFGKEAIGIFLFEQLKEDSRLYYKSICDFLQIDAKEAFELLSNRHENKRLTIAHMQKLKNIQKWPRKNLAFRRANRRLRKRMVGTEKNNPAFDAPPYEIEVNKVWRENIKRVTRDGNRYLVEFWNLPLETYGYSL